MKHITSSRYDPLSVLQTPLHSSYGVLLAHRHLTVSPSSSATAVKNVKQFVFKDCVQKNQKRN